MIGLAVAREPVLVSVLLSAGDQRAPAVSAPKAWHVRHRLVQLPPVGVVDVAPLHHVGRVAGRVGGSLRLDRQVVGARGRFKGAVALEFRARYVAARVEEVHLGAARRLVALEAERRARARARDGVVHRCG